MNTNNIYIYISAIRTCIFKNIYNTLRFMYVKYGTGNMRQKLGIFVDFCHHNDTSLSVAHNVTWHSNNDVDMSNEHTMVLLI